MRWEVHVTLRFADGSEQERKFLVASESSLDASAFVFERIDRLPKRQSIVMARIHNIRPAATT